MKNEGLLIILSGPSGIGKDTILTRLFGARQGIVKSVSVTTRPPREGEVDGRDYFFVPKQTFYEIIANNGLLEYAEYCGQFYGTLQGFVTDTRRNGTDVLLKIEVQGARAVKQKCPEAVSIFVIPPSLQVLEQRLRGRGTESDKSLRMRLQRAQDEMESACEYDYVVVNDEIGRCVHDICSIIDAEKAKSCRMRGVVEEVLQQCKNYL